MRVLLTHTPEALETYYGPRALAALREVADVRLNKTGAVLDGVTLAEATAGCEVVINDRQTAATPAFFTAASDCVAVLRCAVDVSNIDIDAASQAGVLVTRATPGFGTAVAEVAVGFMIDLARGISAGACAYRAGRTPQGRLGRQLAGSTLGVIGYGVIGRRLADLAKGLGMSVLVADPYRRPDDPALKSVPLEELLAQAHFVVLLAPANTETAGMMDAAAFSAMRPDAFFLNLSRGELVDEGALAEALDARRIAGAAIDVGMAPDQMPSPALAARADVVATPHLAGATPAAVEHQAYDTVEQVSALAAGRMPPHGINATAATRLIRLGIAPDPVSSGM